MPCKFPFIGRPFRGLYFYEWQIGPFIFMVRHAQVKAWRKARGKRTSFLLRWDSAWVWHVRQIYRRRRHVAVNTPEDGAGTGESIPKVLVQRMD